MTESFSLSRGRTRIDRRHANIGNVIHQAGDAIEYVHLSVIKGMSLDTDCPNDVDVVSEKDQDVQIRVLIGEKSESLFFNISCDIRSETKLVDNLCVHPYERVVVSISDPNARLVVNGVVTRKPVLR